MNCANALALIALGTAMWAAPLFAPQWFPRTGIDGSSTQSLWLGTVGAAQCLLAGAYLLQGSLLGWWARLPTSAGGSRPELTETEVPTDHVYDIDFNPALAQAPTDSITLNGDYADLWRAFHRALHSDGPASHLAAQIVTLAEREGIVAVAEAEADNVVTFIWTPEQAAREAAEADQRLLA